MVEAWINRNSALGAWQYPIPPDASPQTIDWDRFLGNAPKRPFEPVRLFRWRNYRDYGTGIPGDLFVHLFTGIHYVLDSIGPTRVMATGGLRFWNDGRDVPDVMLGAVRLSENRRRTPRSRSSLKVNFAEGAGESQAFRFVGPEGVLTIGGNGVTLAKSPRPRNPAIRSTPSRSPCNRRFLKEYQREVSDCTPELRPRTEEVFAAPGDYDARLRSLRDFFDAMRSRKPVTEDAVFGFRAAAPALLTNDSYFEGQPISWDPEGMKRLAIASR